MERILEYLISNLENGNILVALMIVIVAIAFKATSIYEFYGKIKESKRRHISDLLDISQLSEDVKDVIKEKANTISFQNATGIYAENPLREILIRHYFDNQVEISLYQLKMAMPHIRLKRGSKKLIVSLGVADTLFYWFENVAALLFTFFALVLLLIPVITKGTTISQLIGLYSLAAFIGFSAWMMFMSSLPYHFAKRLKPIIERQ